MNLQNFKEYLNQPYPFFYDIRSNLLLSLIIFFMVLIFTYIFEPFGVHYPEHKMHYFWICFIHSLVPFILILISPIFLSVKIENEWKISNEVIYIFILLICIGAAQFLIRDIIYDNPHNWSWRYFFIEIKNTLYVGILFIWLFVPITHALLRYKNIQKAEQFTSRKSTLNNGVTEITIETLVKSDTFILNPQLLQFAKSEGNYTKVYIEKGNKVETIFVRISLKHLESQLSGFDFIIRTHRSYLVNLNAVTNISGNAQGFKLQFDEPAIIAHVSRKMIDDFHTRRKHLK